MTKTAAIYARVSTEKQADGYSLETQIEACQEYANELGFEVVGEFVDKLSGGSFERPELQRAITMAGKVDALICYVQDRLARTNEIDALYLIHDLNKRGMGVYLAHERKCAETDTFIGQLETLIRAKVAREEREKIAERMMRGKKGKMKAGKVVLPTPPFGYDKTDDDHLVINALEAAIVQKIYDWYLFGDRNGRRMGLARIAKQLTQEGIATPADRRGYGRKSKREGVWSIGSVSYVLTNPTYKGEWLGGKGQFLVSVPVIIEPEVWELAQQQGKKNMNNAKRNTKNSYLLRSAMSCLTCGYHFHGLAHAETGKMYYRCGGQHIQNTVDFKHVKCCGYLRGDEVDTLVWNAIVTMLKCPDLILEEYKKRKNGEMEDSKMTRDYITYCEEQIQQLEGQRSKVLDLYINERIPHALLDEKLVDIDQKLATHRDKLAELQQRLVQIHTVPDDYEELVRAFCETTLLGLENLTDEDKRAVIEILDIHVYVERGETREEDVFELTGFIPTVRIDSTSSWKNGNNNDTGVSIASTSSSPISIPRRGCSWKGAPARRRSEIPSARPRRRAPSPYTILALRL